MTFKLRLDTPGSEGLGSNQSLKGGSHSYRTLSAGAAAQLNRAGLDDSYLVGRP